MIKFNKLKIGSKLILSMTALIVMLIVTISIFIGLRVQKMSEIDVQEIAKETAYHYAITIEAELEVALDEARALGSLLESIVNTEELTSSRREINSILKYFIEHNQQFLGAYVGFEPNAFDNKDQNFINEPGHDNTGRFIPYWSRNKQGEGVLEPLFYYDQEGKGDYYQLTKKRKRETVLNPYFYPVQGKDILMASLVVPILSNQREFVGIAALDVDFKALQQKISQLQISSYRNAFANFYASDGTVIAAKDSSFVGKHVSQTTDNQELIDYIMKNEPFLLKRYSQTIGQTVFTYGAPIEIGYTGIRWMVTINIPDKELKAEAQKTILLIATIGLVALFIGIFAVYLLAKRISNPLNKLVNISKSIASGNLDNDIVWRGQDEIGQLLQSFDQMQTQLRDRVLEEKRVANEALRINQALHNVNTSVLITDNNFKIIYLNQSAQQLFKERQAILRQYFPTFEVNQLLGSSIDRFHKHPNYQRELLEQLATTHSGTINIGNLSWGIKVSPVRNDEGQRLGWVAEFSDRTAEVATEQEVSAVMTAASLGDYKQRINLTDKTGFFKTFSQHLNKTLDYTQQMIDELRRVFESLARGDLSQTVTNSYTGSLELLKNDVNIMVKKLTLVVHEIQQATGAASQGDFSKYISLVDKEGFFATLSKLINQTLEANQRIIGELQKVFAAVADGNLTQTIVQDYVGSLEQLKQNVNTTVDTLTNVINTVKQSAEVVSHAAEEISQGNANLNHRTGQQAASLEETAASMEEMTSTVQQNSDHAQQAKQLAEQARNYAVQGGEAVNAVISAMKEINHSSRKMSEILAVINDIAFQTNLLALNAAVEAARAGEQGRGFAVVASEVRNLAQRSAEAAKEIKQLIEDSIEEVEDGTRLVNQSGNTLQDIMEAVKRVSDIIADIAAASLEQTSGIQQVNKVITQLDEMTQQNAALVEEATSASESLKEQSQRLKEHVGFFKTKEIHYDATEPPSKPTTSPKGVVKLEKTSSRQSKTAKKGGWEDF